MTLKNFRINKWIMMLLILFAVIILTGILIFRLSEHYVSIKGQHLNEYRFSSGGGMNGGYYSETVKRYDDTRAFISIERAEWHYQDPTVKEYFVDAAILDELEAVVRKYRMNTWHRKEFTNIFVADGETDSYHFDFDEDTVYFSSQIYPERYWKKLSKLDDVIKKYLENAAMLPGLVNEKTDEEENYDLPENRVEIYVSSYIRNNLEVKILNGKDEDIEISESYRLINADTDQVIAEKESTYTNRVYGQSWDNMRFPLEKRLEAGNYKLILEDAELLFEIR